jgi:hypothetical protein
MKAVRILASQTNVSNPLYREMSLSIRDAARAAGQLNVAIVTIQYVDSGYGQTLAYEAIRSAHQLLGSAIKNAASGTDMLSESPRSWT